MRRIFHVFARILLALDVVVASVAIFLFSLVMIGFEKSWVIVIAGIGAMFVADIIYVIKTKQRLAIIFALIYIPAIATMLYIVLAGVGAVAWNVGWLLIILSLIVDFAIIAISLGKNKHYKQEVLDSWQEN
jgi:hypothetical protein